METQKVYVNQDDTAVLSMPELRIVKEYQCREVQGPQGFVKDKVQVPVDFFCFL